MIIMDSIILRALIHVHAYGRAPNPGESMMLICIVAVVAIGIVIWWANTRKDSSKPKPAPAEHKPAASDEAEHRKLKISSTPSSVTVSSHEIVSLYSYRSADTVWICPDCETENSTVLRKCRSCGYVRRL